MKKNYKPKPEKVEKLTKLYTEIKMIKAVKCDIFTKTAKIIGILVLFSSCSAQYHLKKALKKDPTIIEKKVLVQKDTLIIRQSYTITDTFTTRVLDTIIIEDEGIKTIVYRNHDVIRVKTIVKGDTIKVWQTIYKPLVKIKDCQHNYWFYVILVSVAILGTIILRRSK
jgi:hypothetical protein